MSVQHSTRKRLAADKRFARVHAVHNRTAIADRDYSYPQAARPSLWNRVRVHGNESAVTAGAKRFSRPTRTLEALPAHSTGKGKGKGKGEGNGRGTGHVQQTPKGQKVLVGRTWLAMSTSV